VEVDLHSEGAPVTFSRLSAGSFHTCGLTSTGIPLCWGRDSLGQLGDGAPHQNTESPSAVDSSVLTVVKNFVGLITGGFHTCGRTAAGQAYCWGNGAEGQLGYGGTNEQYLPVEVDASVIPGGIFGMLVRGMDSTCGLTPPGEAWCWGRDEFGQLGNGDALGSSLVPWRVDQAAVPVPRAFVRIYDGFDHSCGLTAKGRAFCWGKNNYGMLGCGDYQADHQSPIAVDTSTITGGKAFRQLALGYYHSCGLTVEGVMYCWGANFWGALGDGGLVSDSSVPVAVDTTPITGRKDVIDIAAGSDYSCALTADGLAYCWGNGAEGALGNGLFECCMDLPGPVDLTPLGGRTFARLALGFNHSCALTGDGTAFCWGADNYGQLGDGGDEQNAAVPRLVDTSVINGVRTFVDLTAGYQHTCAITASGVPYCWGCNSYGGLGNGEGGWDTDTVSPVEVDISGL
jgi:alpha-tubulin suppressor-like RCC1 family protein